MIRAQIKNLIHAALVKIDPQLACVHFDVVEAPLETGADVASNIGFALAKQLRCPPQKAAEQVAAAIAPNDVIQTLTAAGGYLNIALQKNYLLNLLNLFGQGSDFLFAALTLPPRRVLVEFVSANPTGPLHVGHGRGAALGDSLARIYRKLRFPIETEYYINDVGVQMNILAQSVEQRSKQFADPELPFLDNGYKGEYIKDIALTMQQQKRSDFSVYPRQAILDGIRSDLKDFGVEFDHWFSEGLLHSGGKIEAAMDALRQKNALKEKDGALWFVNSAVAKDKEFEDQDRVLRKSDGRTTYFAADLAYHREKILRGYDTFIDIWGHDHHGYVARMQAGVAALGAAPEQLHILLYQLVSLKRGGAKVPMSTRSGEFITLKSIIDEVGRDACRFFFAMRSPNSQLDFDVDLALKKSNENPVFYVQYVHARIASIFREAKKRGVDSQTFDGEQVSLAAEEKNLLVKLAFFADVCENAVQIDSPHGVANFLLDVAAKFHKFYDRHRVIDAATHERALRLKLLNATAGIVREGLDLLGVSAPEQM